MVIILVLILLSTFTEAQVGTILDSSKLPQCAFSCQTLRSAEQLCVPPIAPTQDQAVYQTCFCNSNYLVNYKAGAVSPTCDEACTTDSDRKEIQQWFVKLCSGGAVVTPEGNQANPVATQPVPGVSIAPTATISSSSRVNSNSGSKSWVSTHWQWVILVIVLILAALGGTVLGIWLKRRHDRKWATGGYARDAMLQTHDIAKSLSNRHPVTGTESMSQVQMPSYDNSSHLDGSRAQASLSGANVKRPALARATEYRRG